MSLRSDDMQKCKMYSKIFSKTVIDETRKGLFGAIACRWCPIVFMAPSAHIYKKTDGLINIYDHHDFPLSLKTNY